MRRKYKLSKSKKKDEIKNETKKVDPPNNAQPTPKNTIEKKDIFPKSSKFHFITSNQRNTISYNSKDTSRFRKFIRFKREDNNKLDNKNDINKNNNTTKNKDNKKENINNNNKNITNNNNTNNNTNNNNENKIYKFDKKRRHPSEFNENNFNKFGKIKNNNLNKNNEKILNTDPNVLNSNSKNEKLKENTKNIRAKYRSKRFNLSININSDKKEKKDNKDNNLVDENPKKHHILENKLKTAETLRKSSNLTYEYSAKNKLDKNDNNYNSHRNEYSKLFSLIKKYKKRSIDCSLKNTNDKINNLNKENNDNNSNNKGKEKEEKEKEKEKDKEKDKDKDKKKEKEKEEKEKENEKEKDKDKENYIYYDIEKKDNFNDMKSTSTSNSRNNRIKSSFNFLIHQAHENLNLSNTFSKMYESYITLTAKKRKNESKKKIEINRCVTTDDNENSEKTKNSLFVYDNSSLNSISYLIKEYGTEKLRNQIKYKPSNMPLVKQKVNRQFVKKGNLRNLLDISPKSQNTNSIINDNNSNQSETINVTNKIVNNNTFNTTYNIYKINSTSKNEFSTKINENILKSSELSHQTISNPTSNRPKYYKISVNKNDTKNDENKKYNINTHQSIDSLMKDSNKYKEIIINKEIIKININEINIENLYLLEAKNKSILNKINNYEICYNECHDWISYYFDNNLYDLFINLFKNKRNKNNIINKIKIEILCFFLCYDASFSKTFSQAGILIKTIFHLLHNNFLLLVVYIMNNFNINNDNNNNLEFNKYLINNLNQIIKEELKINLSLQEIHNENCIIEIIEQNFKQINNYYKMIIDNLYNYSILSMISSSNDIDDINNNKIYKFPQCLSLDLEKINNNQKIRIISLFFFDAYKLLNNYNILDLKIFYDLFLNKKINKNKNENKKTDSVQRFNNYNKNKYRNEYYNILSHNFKNNNNSKYFLFPIKSYYEYTLMINLDTLVYYNELTDIYNINTDKNKKVILRPGVFKFLQEMKQIYELVLFSNNSFDYISKILKHFSNNEKFFEYILTNNQIIFEEDDSIKNIDLLGRDLKHIIILDKVQSKFKLNKENIIYVKPFYGDTNNDGDILNNLIEILKKIKYEMEDTDDIRISLNNYKFEILTKVTTYLF